MVKSSGPPSMNDIQMPHLLITPCPQVSSRVQVCTLLVGRQCKRVYDISFRFNLFEFPARSPRRPLIQIHDIDKLY